VVCRNTDVMSNRRRLEGPVKNQGYKMDDIKKIIMKVITRVMTMEDIQ